MFLGGDSIETKSPPKVTLNVNRKDGDPTPDAQRFELLTACDDRLRLQPVELGPEGLGDRGDLDAHDARFHRHQPPMDHFQHSMHQFLELIQD